MKDERKRVLVIAGHGGRDKGAPHPDGKTWEVDITMPAASALGMALRLLGHDAMIGRSMLLASNEKWEINDRVRWANSLGADLLVSIHANASPCHTAEGSEVLYYRSGKQLAEMLAPAIAIEPWRDRGAKYRDDLGVLKRTTMPAVLLELGFVDDNDGDAWDDRIWLLKHWPEQIGRAAAVIHKWLGERS